MKVLAKQHGFFSAIRSAGVWTALVNDNWEQAPAPLDDIWYSSSYIDLKGVAINGDTVFPKAATVQYAGRHALAGPAGSSMIIHDIVTSIPIDTSDQTVLNGIFTFGVGFHGGTSLAKGTLNFEHVIYGRSQRWANDLDVAANFPEMREELFYGSMQPTASDRLYCYRFVGLYVTGDTGMDIPPARQLFEVDTKEEPEYQHLMRLKRSYDLQQSYDED
jgi:hypothetical protein